MSQENNNNNIFEECKSILLSNSLQNKDYQKCILNLYSKIEELEKENVIYKCTRSEIRSAIRKRPWLGYP